MIRKGVVAVLLLVAVRSAHALPDIYVDADATGSGTGSSWANAMTEVSAAISSVPPDGEIWVAAGTYAGDITLSKNLRIYGGFAATETQASQSNPLLNPTIITGSQNTRVLSATGLNSTTVLRGLQFVSGSVSTLLDSGGGLLLVDSSPAIVECIFSQNTSGLGAAVAVLGMSSPTFINSKFVDNDAVYCGAGVFIDQGASPSFQNCLFEDNDAMEGGAICNMNGAPTLVNCTFVHGDVAPVAGGAISDYPRTTIMRNCIVWDNTATRAGTAAFYNTPGVPGAMSVTNSIIQGSPLWPGDGNKNADPMFMDPGLADFELQCSSPGRDTGDTAVLPVDTYDLDWDGDVTETIPFDLNGVLRIQGLSVDMGAYEHPTMLPPDPDLDNPNMGDGAIVRFLSFEPVNAGEMTALRVTLTNLPPPSADHNGEVRWVAAPNPVCDNQGQTSPPCSNPSSSFQASRLSCAPAYRDWGTISTLYIYDEGIVPGAVYDVRAIRQGCDEADEGSYSDSLTINTSVWGDVTGGFDSGTGTWTPPDGSVDLSTDYTAVLDKFTGGPSAPHKARCDMDPEIPNRMIGIPDILVVITAFTGGSYPFAGPTDCP